LILFLSHKSPQMDLRTFFDKPLTKLTKEQTMSLKQDYKSLQQDYIKRQLEFFENQKNYVELLQSEHQALQSEHQVLQSEHQALQSEHQALQSEHQALQSEHQALQSEHQALVPPQIESNKRTHDQEILSILTLVEEQITNIIQNRDTLCRYDYNGCIKSHCTFKHIHTVCQKTNCYCSLVH